MDFLESPLAGKKRRVPLQDEEMAMDSPNEGQGAQAGLAAPRNGGVSAAARGGAGGPAEQEEEQDVISVTIKRAR